MAVMPLQARELLTRLSVDLCFDLPTYHHETDIRGLTMVFVTVYIKHPHLPPLAKTFSSPFEDNIAIAEDLASRMALRYLQAYYVGDNHVTPYFNNHIISHTKRAWQTIAECLANQLDQARDTIRSLYDKLYHSRIEYNNLSTNIRHSQMFDTLKNNAQMRELNDENTKQRCQITVLENRLQYLENMNVLLCTTHLHLLQLPKPNETSSSANSAQVAGHAAEGQNAPPLPTRANLTEL